MSQEIKKFYDVLLSYALKKCMEKGCEPMFMPELVDARIQGKAKWDEWYSTPSVRATGKTKQGNAVVIYAHISNYFSNLENLDRALTEEGHAKRMPQEEFQKLLDAEDNKRVFVIDYNKIKNSKIEHICLEHPVTIPFFGGRERAEKYLEEYRKVYTAKRRKIQPEYKMLQLEEMRLVCADDLKNEPMGRLLFLDYEDSDNDYALTFVGDLDYFLGYNDMFNKGGHFLGIHK
jgi:hypothetical protein